MSVSEAPTLAGKIWEIMAEYFDIWCTTDQNCAEASPPESRARYHQGATRRGELFDGA